MDINFLQKEAEVIKGGTGADFADAYFEDSSTRAVVLEDDKIDRIISGNDSGMGLRAFKGKEVSYNFESLPEAAFPHSNRLEDQVLLLEKANQLVRSVSRHITQVTVSYSEKIQRVSIADSNGKKVSGDRVLSRFLVNVIASKDGVLQTGYESFGGTFLFDKYDPSQLLTLSRQAAERAVRMLDAKHAPSGSMPVVILSQAGGTLIHEACGHGLEADFIVKKTSVYEGKLGEKVASELITVIDDATIPELYGSFDFDDEGTPAQRKILIENGILKGYMSDIYNSGILGMTSSGNGRRENYMTKPQPRMTNTYIEKGSSGDEEIISSVKKGLLVKKLGGGQVNVTNGDFVFDIQEGYILENGKIKDPVRGAILIGNGAKVLNDIDMVGNELHFMIGTCGKGDHAPVSDAMPTVRIPEIVVGGRA